MVFRNLRHLEAIETAEKNREDLPDNLLVKGKNGKGNIYSSAGPPLRTNTGNDSFYT